MADPSKMQVTFANNVMAEIVSTTANSLVLKVHQGAVAGKISVNNKNKSVRTYAQNSIKN